MRVALLVLLLGTACSAASASTPSAHPKASSIAITPAPRPTPVPDRSFTPSPNFLGGVVVFIDGSALEIQTFEGDAQRVEKRVELVRVRSVWKETLVGISAIEVGDDLMIAGTSAADAFYARDIWVNIGRIDGVIRAIDGENIALELLLRGRPSSTITLTLSPYITPLGPWRIADLRPGMKIGAVIYRASDGQRRITRIWTD